MRIAAFDSGVGGLIAIAPLLKNLFPLEVYYLGDLANLPYGTKSSRRIKELTLRNVGRLLNLSDKNFERLILACNTASAHALNETAAACMNQKLECEGVIHAGCQATLLSKPTPSRIVVLATSATVKSEVYPNTLREMGYQNEIVQVAAPLFVPLVEAGLENSPAAQFAVHHYLGSVIQPGDCVILGCTHYPLLRKILQKELPQVSQWIEAGEALLKERWTAQILRSTMTKDSKNSLKIYLTDTTVSPQSIHELLSKLEIKDLLNIEVLYLEALG
jgi:glutamate racemase